MISFFGKIKNFIKVIIIILLISSVFWSLKEPVFASPTDGTIDSVYKYAWGENTGWINFGCSNCNVHITDSAITGYVWSENYGWINLAPTTSGIKNDGEGNLSGYAWGENLDWINFSGVKIDSSGKFIGAANGVISGIINFDCLNCKVITDWRPKSVRSAVQSGKSENLGGGFMPLKTPAEGFKILINNNALYTDNLSVVLSLFGSPETSEMMISNFSDFRDARREPYSQIKIWDLCKGQEEICENLRKSEIKNYEFKVYARFYAPWGASSEIVSDSIFYQNLTAAKIIKEIKELPGEIIKPESSKEIKLPETSSEEKAPEKKPQTPFKWKFLIYKYPSIVILVTALIFLIGLLFRI